LGNVGNVRKSLPNGTPAFAGVRKETFAKVSNESGVTEDGGSIDEQRLG